MVPSPLTPGQRHQGWAHSPFGHWWLLSGMFSAVLTKDSYEHEHSSRQVHWSMELTAFWKGVPHMAEVLPVIKSISSTRWRSAAQMTMPQIE